MSHSQNQISVRRYSRLVEMPVSLTTWKSVHSSFFGGDVRFTNKYPMRRRIWDGIENHKSHQCMQNCSLKYPDSRNEEECARLNFPFFASRFPLFSHLFSRWEHRVQRLCLRNPSLAYKFLILGDVSCVALWLALPTVKKKTLSIVVGRHFRFFLASWYAKISWHVRNKRTHWSRYCAYRF